MAAFFDNLGGTANQIFNATPAEVLFKDPIGIIQIADDQIEIREIVCQLCRQVRIAREETGKRSVFDRSNCLRVEAVFRKRCDVLVTKDLDMRIGMGLAERFERWQSKNEVTDRATANYQNPVHEPSTVAALYGRRNQWWRNLPSQTLISPLKLDRVVGGRRSPLQFSILRKGKRENHAAVNQRDGMQTAPAKRASRGPIDLITQHVGDGHPE